MNAAHHHPHAPRQCPVCGDELALTRLSCEGCETELSGLFRACEFCALDAEDRELLRVFLSSRGNLKQLQRYLGVSYPTARIRFAELLHRLGIEAEEEPVGTAGDDDPDVEILAALARGDIDVDEAERRMEAGS